MVVMFGFVLRLFYITMTGRMDNGRPQTDFFATAIFSWVFLFRFQRLSLLLL